MSWVLTEHTVGSPCEPQVCDCGHSAGHEFAESKLYSAVFAGLCLLCASMAAGMSIGFSSMDQYELQVLIEANEDDCQSVEEKEKLVEERRIASLILPTLKKGNRLLVTFVIVTAVANEALPLFLDQLFPEWIACLLSVLLVVFVCEILPALMFRRGPRQMQLSAYMIPMVKFLMFVLAPIVRPVAYLLDLFIESGEDTIDVKYTRAKMNAMLNMHVVCSDPERTPTASSSSIGNGLARKEVHAIQTIISSRVVWKTMYKLQVVNADSIFRGLHTLEQMRKSPRGSSSVAESFDKRDAHLLVMDATGLIGSISAADLAEEHARHGDVPIRQFTIKKLVFIDTTTQDPALFDVLCRMVKAESDFTICGSAENPEGFVTMKSIVAQLVCDNENIKPCVARGGPLAKRRSSLTSDCPDASQLKELQQFALKKMTTIENFSDDSGNDNDSDNEGDEDVVDCVPEAVKRRLIERRKMFSQEMN